MKITKIEHLQDPEDREIDRTVLKYEERGYEVVQVGTAASQSDYTPHSFVTIVFQKEKE